MKALDLLPVYHYTNINFKILNVYTDLVYVSYFIYVRWEYVLEKLNDYGKYMWVMAWNR